MMSLLVSPTRRYMRVCVCVCVCVLTQQTPHVLFNTYLPSCLYLIR